MDAGPARRLRAFLARCAACRDGLARGVLAPLFVFTRGRPTSPYVNLERPTCLGAPQPGAARPCWALVVDPGEAAAYAARHPDALFLVLPVAGRRVGYARHVAQTVARTGATRTAFYWSLDDNLVRFQKWVPHRQTGARVEAKPAAFPRFLEALLYAQSLDDVAEYAQIGFLRQRGTAVRASRAHASNVFTIYKCLLLNNAALERAGVASAPPRRDEAPRPSSMYDDARLST